MKSKCELGHFQVVMETEKKCMYELTYVVSAGEDLYYFALFKKYLYECDEMPEDRELVRLLCYKENREELDMMRKVVLEKSNQLRELCGEFEDCEL